MKGSALFAVLVGLGVGGLWACGSVKDDDDTQTQSSGGASPSSGGSTSGGSNGADAPSGGMGGMNGSNDDPQGASCGSLPRLEAGGEAFDCGPQGHVFENAGRPDNRVNYVITGDGYSEDMLDTVFVEHVENMLYHEQTGQYSALGEPYARYRKFVNVCGLKVASNDGCIDNPDIGRSCDTPFDGRCDPSCAPNGTRLGSVNRGKVQNAMAELLPDFVDVDWAAVTLNGDSDGWWNSGGPIMVWNGNFGNRVNAASVALHEGGHTFHRLADEYGGSNNNCGEFQEVNSTADPTGAKWAQWLGYDDARNDERPRPNNQSGNPYGTRVHGVYEGSRYCNSGQYRPSEHSQMNILPRPFNMPSVEKIILDIYSIVDPIDNYTDNSEPLVNPSALQVRVVDPEVIQVEWSIDGEVVAASGGECFDLPELMPGMHTVTARAYDDTPWVRRNRELLESSVSWEIVIQ